MTNEKRMKLLQNFAIAALILIILHYANGLFESQLTLLATAANAIILPFGIALFISYLLAPIIKFVQKRLKVKNELASVVIVLFGSVVVGLIFIIFVGNMIYQQSAAFISSDWDNIVASVERFAENNPEFEQVLTNIQSYLSFESVTPALVNVLNIFRSAVGIIVSVVLTPVFLVFLLLDKDRIFAGIVSVIPKKYQTHAVELGKRANIVIEKYFNGRFLSMFIMSIFFTILFFILGFKERSIFFGFTLGFLDIIPYIGGFIGMLLPLLYSFTISEELLFEQYTYIAVVVVNIVGQALQGNIIQPWIMGREVQLHPMLVLSSFIFFGALFGITGVILAIPITGIIKTSFEYFNELKEKPQKAKKKPV